MAFGQDEVRIKITTDDQTRRGTDSAKRNMGQLDGTLGGIKKNWLAVGAAAGVATVAIGGAVRVAASMVSAASDMEESVSKVNVVFGESAQTIHDWSETSATAMGLSQQAALESAGTFGNLFTAMGLTQNAAAPLSQSVVQLAVDLGSFNNIASDEALIKLRAGLVGEAEPLRTLGINLSAAATELKAMELGLVDTKAELTEAIKIQARWAIITEQSTTAAGDFARTSGGLANQTKALSAQWDDMKASLGSLLIGPVTEGVVLLNELFTVLDDLTSTTHDIVVRISMQEVPGAGGLTFGDVLGAAGRGLGAVPGVIGRTGTRLGAQGISTIGAVLPGVTVPRSQPDESALFAERPFQEATALGQTAVGALADAFIELQKTEKGAEEATKRAKLQIELLHGRLDDAAESSAALSAAEQARGEIIAQQTSQVVEAFLQEQLGAEGRIAAIREQQQGLDDAWVDVAEGLSDLGILVPDEFRSMWEEMQRIQKEEQQKLLEQQMNNAARARLAQARILGGQGTIEDFAFVVGQGRDPNLTQAESDAAQKERDLFQSFLDGLLSGEVGPTMDSISAGFNDGMVGTLQTMIDANRLFIDELGRVRANPTFIVQIGGQEIEDVIVTAIENAESSGRITRTVVG